MEGAPPTIKLAELEEFERKRCGYFADDFCKSTLYWASLCETMQDNDGSTDQVLAYIAGKMETDRIYCASVYANADKVFGDKKGAAKLRHDKIRQEEQRAKMKGEKLPEIADALVAGGAKREVRPANSTVNAVWEMAEMDCRAARYRDELCDDLEEENMLGKVKTMRNETQKRLHELILEGNACLLSLRNIDKQVGNAFLHLKEILGNQLGGQALHEDVWFLNTRYHTAVVHQKEAWLAVNKKLSEVFQKLKDLEVNRRAVLRDFMVGANKAVFETWSMLPKLCSTATNSADAIMATGDAVDQLVNARMATGAEAKIISNRKQYELANTTNMTYADPSPSDDSFIEGLTAPLESPLVRTMMMIERREGKALGSKYYPGLMVLSWQGFIHFFDIPESSGLKKDVSPAAALQDISPTISLDDLLSNRKDLDEVLMFKSTYTLQLEAESTVDGPSSKKSQHKIEVKGKVAFKQLFKSGIKTITFRTANEAEMNHALGNIKEAIQDVGGVCEGIASGRLSSGGRTSFGSVRSDSSTKEPEEAPSPPPSHKASLDKTPEETTPAPTDGCDPSADKEKEKEEPVAA